jgi:hypothetical protein
MKKILLVAGGLLGLITVIVLIFLSYVAISDLPTYDPPQVTIQVKNEAVLVQRGALLSSMLCNHCHMARDSRQLTGRKVEDIDPVFGEIYSSNITQHPVAGIGSWTDEELAILIRTGIKKDGSYAPPYMPKFPLMSNRDLEAIIAFLKSDHPLVAPSDTGTPDPKPSFMTKMLSRVAFKPLPYPDVPIMDPDTTDVLALGEYLSNGLYGCFHCHSADFKTNNELEPSKSSGFYGGGNKLYNLKGEVVYSPNITPHETGIKNWSREEFIELVRFGRKPDGSAIAYPMLPYAGLSEYEVNAMYEYLLTVPPIQNKVGK